MTEKPGSQISGVIRPTTFIEAPRLARHLGADILIASETFQYTGSFKFRAAYSVASQVPQDLLITASSGNFGQALAYACGLLKKSCIVVMPVTSAKVKVDAVREYGGHLELVDLRAQSRQERVSEIAGEHPEAYIASAYDDPLVIQGNSSLGEEIGAMKNATDVVLVPVGGGGLSSGIILGLERAGRGKTRVVGAEPFIANDAARSLRAGKIVANDGEPQTIADGARSLSVGKHNWEILRTGLSDIVEVREETIVKSVRLLFQLANLKVEPTGALSVAAAITKPELFRGQKVCCVVSGGNVDPAVYAKILEGD